MNIITTPSDLEALFKLPFEPKTIIYSLNSDFFRNGNSVCKTGLQQVALDLDDELLPFNTLPEFPCGERGCRTLFTTVHDYDIHFRSVHSIVCSECKRCFPTYNMLDVHIQEKHDSYYEAAKAKNLAKFECFVEGCSSVFSSSEQRDSHVTGEHNFPSNFKYQQLKKTFQRPEEMEVTEENEPCIVPNSSSSSRRKTPYVPKSICFGRGSAKTFAKVSRGKSKREISMKELADAL